nr:unnamed protein product [Callosobruchus chinensis]
MRKVQPTPTCELTCLGFTYNTLDMTLFLPEKKKRDTKDSLKKFKNKNKGSIQFFSKLIGKLVAAGPTLKYGWVHIKNFEREKYLPLKKFNNNYNMPPLQMGRAIWDWCEANDISIFASSVLRKKKIQTLTFSLGLCHSKQSMNSLTKFSNQFVGNLKNPEIDLFASKLNAKLAKVLDKISNYKATGIVIVPNWPTQPWYPLFKKLVDIQSNVLELMKNLLLHYIRALHWLPGYYPESNDKMGVPEEAIPM